MAITAALVKELRERTGAAMMDCKKALVEANGDVDAAIETMRASGQAKAIKKAGRVTAEGRVVARTAETTSIIIEVNCETDFVGKDDNFVSFVDRTADVALQYKTETIEALMAATYANGQTVEEARQELVNKIGENIQIRRLALMTANGSYLHGAKIGVLVNVEGGDNELAKDIAMHVAASKPEVILPEEVPADRVEAERRFLTDQALESGKPKEVVDKMIDGRMRKFLGEISLVGQPFVKDPSFSVSDLLKQHNAKVTCFVRYEVGEGVDKKVDNFAEEVMAQVRGSE